MFMRRPPASAPFRNRNASGNVSTGAVTPPSTCISWKRRPFASASISIGGKTTGMLADAGRGAGRDDVSRHEIEDGRAVFDQPRVREDQHRRIGRLHHGAIDARFEL